MRYHYRRLYPYTCAECGERRLTRKHARRTNEVCAKCERKHPAPGQESLFEQTPRLNQDEG